MPRRRCQSPSRWAGDTACGEGKSGHAAQSFPGTVINSVVTRKGEAYIKVSCPLCGLPTVDSWQTVHKVINKAATTLGRRRASFSPSQSHTCPPWVKTPSVTCEDKTYTWGPLAPGPQAPAARPAGHPTERAHEQGPPFPCFPHMPGKCLRHLLPNVKTFPTATHYPTLAAGLAGGEAIRPAKPSCCPAFPQPRRL